MTLEIITRKGAKALGLNKYFTGKPCSKGHYAPRKVISKNCLECRREWITKNKEKILASERKRLAIYRMENRETLNERRRQKRNLDKENFNKKQREYIARNRDKILARLKIYREKTKEKVRLNRVKWTKENPERMRGYRAKDYKLHKENYLANARTRRARLNGCDGTHTARDISAIRIAQRNKCAYCRETLGKFHIDHIVAISRGGSNDRKNLQILCCSCNLSKNARDPVEFAQSIGLLI